MVFNHEPFYLPGDILCCLNSFNIFGHYWKGQCYSMHWQIASIEQPVMQGMARKICVNQSVNDGGED